MANQSNALETSYATLKQTSLLDLFKHNPQRAKDFSINVGELNFDYSKNHIDHDVIGELIHLANNKALPAAIESLFNGEKLNNTEQRAALHTALRKPNDNTDISEQVQQALSKMQGFVESIHKQQWLGYTGKNIETIVNIGIGGSDLGPRMVVQALSPYHSSTINVLFVANIDGADLEDTLRPLNPETTLFVIASKTFTTLETLSNANSARQWAMDAGCKQAELYKHFVAISSNLQAAVDFGIAEDNIFPMWDWVGGRYSLWSAIGLPIALALGMDHFRDLLAGAHEMDIHFKEAPLKNNMPVIAALLSYWYSHYWRTSSHAVLPYAQRLSRFPAYLQQLDMESLGKRVNKQGDTLNYPTGLVIWGTEGTNGQHSFHQLLHQGSQIIPVDFITIKKAMSRYTTQHQHLLACGISQAQALLQGKSLTQAEAELWEQGLNEDQIKTLAPHKVIPGNKPSNMIILEELSPKNLGALIALYEHKTYVSSVLLGINAFDQWGVELGKQLGKPLYTALTTGDCSDEWDSSTIATVNRLA